MALDRPLAPIRAARGARGAVVAPHHLATAAGLEVLAAGGSAVDAAIATNAALAVVLPSSCGIGGDAFWLVWDEAAGEQVALNGSGRAPAGADPAALRRSGLTRLPSIGPLTITVPGAVRSWGDAHRRWGRLPIARVLGPAHAYAAEGFPAGNELIGAIERTAAAIGDAPWGAGFHAVYRPHGRPWRPGEVIRLPALARTMERLASEGLDTYYDGALGESLAGALAAAGAPFAWGDLAGHASTWGVPISTTYRGVRVTSHPPNSSGVLALEILNILEQFEAPPASAFGPTGWTDARWLHLALEAAKAAYADRERFLGDPAVRPVPVERLLDKAHAAALAAQIDPGRADPAPPPARTLVGGTVYLGAADAEGNAVSLIESNAKGFGSGVVDPVTGVHFQNRGASFSLDPDHVNALAPGRRTAHTLLPGMLFREGERRPWVVAGSMGGDIQPQIHAAFVSALVDAGQGVAATVSAPRVTVVPDGYLAPPVAVEAEDRFAPGVLDTLVGLGHRVERGPAFDPGQGLGHAIALVDGGPAAGGSYEAATDPRCAGLPATR